MYLLNQNCKNVLAQKLHADAVYNFFALKVSILQSTLIKILGCNDLNSKGMYIWTV